MLAVLKAFQPSPFLCGILLPWSALAVEGERIEAAPRAVLIAPAPVAAGSSLFQLTAEPTKHQVRWVGGEGESWQQGIGLATRLPVGEAVSLVQEFKAGLQVETTFTDLLSTASRDALTTLERTAAELRLSEALKWEVSAQQQWLANNSVPFAEIVSYGTELKFAPSKTGSVALQAQWEEREQFPAPAGVQQSYRVTGERQLGSPAVRASAGAAYAVQEDAGEAITTKLESALKWTPVKATTFTLRLDETRRALPLQGELEIADLLGVILQQQLHAQSRVELQAGYELRSRTRDETALAESSAWNLGASSDIRLLENTAAGFGVRYRLREDSPFTAPTEEVSFTLSVKGQF